MTISREVKRAINQRAYFVARSLPNAFVAQMSAAVESGDLDAESIAEWWPAEFDPARMRLGPIVNAAPVDVCSNCDAALPEGCGDQFKGDMSCERRKRGFRSLQSCDDSFADVSPPYRKPGEADPDFDATDHLAGF